MMLWHWALPINAIGVTILLTSTQSMLDRMKGANGFLAISGLCIIVRKSGKDIELWSAVAIRYMAIGSMTLLGFHDGPGQPTFGSVLA